MRRLANALRALGAQPPQRFGRNEHASSASGVNGGGYQRAAPFSADPITLHSSTALALTTSFGTIHLRRDVAGVGGFDDARRRATRVRAFGLELAVLDLSALAQMRTAAGRRSDVARLPMLETLLALPALEDRHRELAAKRTSWIDN
jgi:hypothetical protein